MTVRLWRYAMGMSFGFALTACGEGGDAIDVPGRAGVALIPQIGTHLDEEELHDREGHATTLYADGQVFQLDFLAAPEEGLHTATRADGVQVKFGALQGDAELPDCHVFVALDGLSLHASRPAVGEADTCEGMAAVAERLPAVERDGEGFGQLRQALAFGVRVGIFNNIPAHSNGTTGTVGPADAWGLTYQCVHYVNRYYAVFYGHRNLRGTGNANQYYGTAAAKGLRAHANGGRTRPQVGDMLTSNGGSYGHIAIVRAVGVDYVDVIHQNWSNGAADNSKRLAMRVVNGTYTVSGFSGAYPVQGWLRR